VEERRGTGRREGHYGGEKVSGLRKMRTNRRCNQEMQIALEFPYNTHALYDENDPLL
jgi:hypothetical protein